MGNHNDFGRLGEQIAANFLKEKGYQILEKNYRYQKAEVDIIAQKDGVLIVVEVKSRRERFLEEISETIGQKKIDLLVIAANHYVEVNDLDLEVRFDVILVIKKGTDFEVVHTEDAFYHF